MESENLNERESIFNKIFEDCTKAEKPKFTTLPKSVMFIWKLSVRGSVENQLILSKSANLKCR